MIRARFQERFAALCARSELPLSPACFSNSLTCWIERGVCSRKSPGPASRCSDSAVAWCDFVGWGAAGGGMLTSVAEMLRADRRKGIADFQFLAGERKINQEASWKASWGLIRPVMPGDQCRFKANLNGHSTCWGFPLLQDKPIYKHLSGHFGKSSVVRLSNLTHMCSANSVHASDAQRRGKGPEGLETANGRAGPTTGLVQKD